jgi:hypothetical protein
MKFQNPLKILSGNKFWLLQPQLLKVQKLLDSPFWFNPLVKRANIVKYNDFPEISTKINTLADFFIPNTNTMMEYNTFCERYNCQLSEEKFIDIRYTIKLAIQKLKLPNSRLNTAQYPQRPILIDIAMSTNKGCSCLLQTLS